jgi:drug/metabolite transporter (DMT)-like permease
VLVVPVGIAASGGVHASPTAWLCFTYVALFSMFLGFFAWYRGLALGGIAKIGQLQLAQPVLTLVWSALVLGEHVSAAMALTALLVLGCVLATQRTRQPTTNASGKAPSTTTSTPARALPSHALASSENTTTS